MKIRFENRHDGSYFVFGEVYLGTVRRLAERRWIATLPTIPPHAVECKTRKAGAEWLEAKRYASLGIRPKGCA